MNKKELEILRAKTGMAVHVISGANVILERPNEAGFAYNPDYGTFLIFGDVTSTTIDELHKIIDEIYKIENAG